MNTVFTIAEIGQAHDGSIDVAHSYIEAIAKTGCDAIKFQTHIAEAESSIHEPFRVRFNTQDKTRYDYWKRMEFSLDEWKELKIHCDEVGLEFMSSPFSNAAVDLLEKVGVKRYKIGSGEVNNFLLLDKIAKTKKPIIVSSGMSSFQELDKTTSFLKEKNVDFSILQCTTSYPTEPKQFGLNVIGELKKRYSVSVGFSDHSSAIETSIAAVALGADIIEFHAVFDKNSTGPDAKSSLTMDEISELVKSIKNIKIALENPINKEDNSSFTELKNIFEKSLAVNKDLEKGHVITIKDLEAKKPKNYGVLASDFESILGMKLNKDLSQWSFLTNEDLMP